MVRNHSSKAEQTETLEVPSGKAVSREERISIPSSVGWKVSNFSLFKAPSGEDQDFMVCGAQRPSKLRVPPVR